MRIFSLFFSRVTYLFCFFFVFFSLRHCSVEAPGLATIRQRSVFQYRFSHLSRLFVAISSSELFPSPLPWRLLCPAHAPNPNNGTPASTIVVVPLSYYGFIFFLRFIFVSV